MLFGDPSDFAIEADVEPNLEPPTAVWGHMCVWCHGEALGDISDLHCSLYPSYLEFGDLAASLDRLWADELVGMDDISAWNFLDGLLYGFHGEVEILDDRTVADCQRDWEVWGRFSFLTNWGEQFDGMKAFILCPPGDAARVLVQRSPNRVLHRTDVSREGIRSSVERFRRWFEQQAIRLQGGLA